MATYRAAIVGLTGIGAEPARPAALPALGEVARQLEEQHRDQAEHQHRGREQQRLLHGFAERLLDDRGELVGDAVVGAAVIDLILGALFLLAFWKIGERA